ncbi:MAG: hypothetical protein MZV64_30080 [Ignavibacteriales bacterium]|nr:hypothetical protein [Ignavibacteriales bacterium]
MEEGRADFVPVFLSDIPALFTQRRHPARRRASCSVSPPDRARLLHARHVRATRHGRGRRRRADGHRRDQRAHAAHATATASSTIDRDRRRSSHTDRPLHEHAHVTESARSSGASASTIADLVEDGATLQMGIGGDPRCGAVPALTTSATSASTPRCSPTASSTSSRRAS